MDREKITKPSSQCSFIGFVLLPLFEALGDFLTELQVNLNTKLPLLMHLRPGVKILP